jgi:hypothetical protein
VQDVWPCGVRDVGAVVDSKECIMPAAGIREDLERGKLCPRLHSLLPELDDIDPTCQDRIEEVGEVRLLRTRIRAEVQPRPSEPAAQPGGAAHPDFLR